MKEGKAYKYAVWCSTEQEGKVPEYVKKQAESWLHIADGNDEDAYVDEQEYEKICKLLKLMVHPDLRCSIYDGLEDYAWLMIVAGLCTYCRNSEQRSRFYVTILLEIARKNFKTFNSAVIFILLMLTEPDFSRFFSVAPDLQLSSELKNAIRKIIKVSPALYDEDEPAFKVLRSQIICLLNENEYTPLAYSQDGMDGKLANAYLADEAGALDDYPVEAMRSSQITLFNKLGIIISTQYPNDNNVMIDEIDIAKKTLDGLLDDRRYFALLYEPDDDLKQGEAWQTDDRAIYQSNPVAVSHQYIFDEIKKKRTLAVLYENKRENYLCKHNNILYKGLGVEGYIDIQKVKLCRIQPDPQWWNGRQVWVGVDLSQTDDNTAVAMVTEDNGYIYARVMGFIPKEKINIKTQKEHVDYQRMISKGECIACGEEVIDYSVVENYVIPDTYQSGAVWIMNKATRTAIRKLKDSDGNYLLNRDVSARWGYTLLGKDVYCSDAMPKMAAKATAVYYGDFSGLAVKVAEDANIEVLREKYATQHAVGVVAWMEIDTKVEDSQKIAKLTMASA